MKKRTFTLSIITLVICFAFCFAYSMMNRSASTSTETTTIEDTTEATTLVSTEIDQNESVGGKKIALQTITNKFGDLTIVSDYAITGNVNHIGMVDSSTQSNGLVCSVDQLSNPNARVLFLVDKDSSVVEATASSRTFVDNGSVLNLEYQYPQYHSENNYSPNAFAYRYDNEVTAIVKDVCSSIWTIDQNNNLSLLWYNEFEWENQ